MLARLDERMGDTMLKIDEDKMNVAQKVLKHVKKIGLNLPQDEAAAHLEAYSNGREQGLSLTVSDSSGAEFEVRKVAFSENRNSDNIVVYVGSDYDFRMNGNVPSEDVWGYRHYFDPDDHKGAAEFIVGFLTARKS